jgi:HAE1 family hydrophobic/amphiphilic exporter-1
MVFLTLMEKSTDAVSAVFARQTKVKLEEIIAGAKISASPIDILGLSFAPIEVKLNGPDLDSLLALSARVQRDNGHRAGLRRNHAHRGGGNPEVRVDVNRQRMADYGLTMAQVGLTLQTAFSGNTDAKYRDGDYEYPIRIALDAFDRRSADDIRQLVVRQPAGQHGVSQTVRRRAQSTAPTRLERRDRVPSVMLTAQVIGRPNGSVNRDIKANSTACRCRPARSSSTAAT